jgi:hypothetical protein
MIAHRCKTPTMHDHSANSPPASTAPAKSWRVFAAFGVALLGCTDRPLDGGEAGATSTGQVTTSSGSDTEPSTPTSGGVTGEPNPGTSTATPSTSTTAAATTTTSPDTDDFTTVCGGFVCEPDLPLDDCPGTQQLDPECPEGHKCTIDESLGETHCVEIVPNPKGLYEPCTVMGHGWSGLDDCGLGMLCWGVNERGEGTCVGLCDGSPYSPDGCICADPKASPTWCQECAVGLCLRSCDPLLQDCVNDEVCYPIADGFTCEPDASGDEGQANDPCEFINVCDAGLMCADPAFVGAGCPEGSTGCCTPFCKFPGGECPNPDQQCVQYFDPAMFPENDPLLDIGVCGLPQ